MHDLRDKHLPLKEALRILNNSKMLAHQLRINTIISRIKIRKEKLL